MTSKSLYREFCKEREGIPLFSRPWWLDAAVGPEAWDVALVIEDGVLCASLAYVSKSLGPLRVITQPAMTQTAGPVLHIPPAKDAKAQRSQEKRLYQSLIDALPQYHVFRQTCDPSVTNWLPFYWRGFQQTTQYSYVINDISDPAAVVRTFSKGKKSDLSKARKSLTVTRGASGADLFEHHRQSLRKQGREILYSKELICSLVNAAKHEDAGEVFAVSDPDGIVHSLYWIVWDESKAYYVVNSVDPEFRGSGSTSLALLEILEFLKGKTKAFDFEGSMIEPVEFSYRQLGGEQQPLQALTHVPNRLLRIALFAIGRL